MISGTFFKNAQPHGNQPFSCGAFEKRPCKILRISAAQSTSVNPAAKTASFTVSGEISPSTTAVPE